MTVLVDLKIPNGFTREQLLAELDRELKLRAIVYPKYVKFGRFTQGDADGRVALMRAVRDVVAQLPAKQTRIQGT